MGAQTHPTKIKKKKKSDSLNKKENEDLKSDINGLSNVYDWRLICRVYITRIIDLNWCQVHIRESFVTAALILLLYIHSVISEILLFSIGGPDLGQNKLKNFT